jgi:hypothetical protein
MKMMLLFAGILVVAIFALGSASQAASPISEICDQAPKSPTCQQTIAQTKKGTNPVVDIIRTAVDILAVLAGVGAVIVIIISGFMFITAGGGVAGQRATDPNRLKTARAALTGAIIGLVIVALAWTIVTFVTNQFVKT